MSNYISEEEMAKIAISKNLIKEYRDSNDARTVYLNDGTEFQIYIKNPHQFHLGIQIYVNNKTIGNLLILRPGQSIWLERYLDSDDKFLFSTYEVENTTEMHYAIAKNGTVKIDFFRERERQSNVLTISSGTSRSMGGDFTYFLDDCKLSDMGISVSDIKLNNNYNGSYSTSTDTFSFCSSNTLLNADCSYNKGTESYSNRRMSSLKSSNIETGRVERGSKSNQKFKTVDMDFESWPFHTENINILPTSRKAISADEVRRKYCSNCGKKVKPADKFCSNCGHKLD